MATSRQLIERSLLEIGVLGEGETATTAAVTTGLERMRGMLDQWLLDGDLVPGFGQVSYEIDEVGKAKQSYTVGRGNDSEGNPADVVADNPFRILTLAYLRRGHQESRPLIEVGAHEYESIYTTHSTWPHRFFLERSYPHAILRFDAPTAYNDSFTIRMEVGIGLGALDDELSLPSAYDEAILLNLALRLAPSHGISPATIGLTAQNARMALNNLRKRNNLPNTSRLDPELHQQGGGWGSWYRGSGRGGWW